ncbi:hypothetical protein HMPREF0551_1967 [Lautropia mirabilis ATCC 51599]|uniref:Uncharacterized protein n=1 Tax=Lautropia mirabilis ATCC 51599 TaxID=887898 RepID=E7RZ53_9BURK|nr:hypothetical protein HMPREF0551_1967 [Lautropia mirabilis ATCC 51599]
MQHPRNVDVFGKPFARGHLARVPARRAELLAMPFGVRATPSMVSHGI